MAFHQTIVLGNLGSDPETKTLPSGTTVTNFSIAVNESWVDRGSNEKREKTTWYRAAAYGKQGDVLAQYLKKGSQIMIIGTVEARAYMGQDGEPRATLELRVREFRFVGGGTGGSGGNQGSGNYDDYAAPPQELDDIPF